MFWLIIHPNIERWRRVGTRAYWVAPFAWLVTAGPLLFYRRRIFSVHWTMPRVPAGIMTAIGVAALLTAVMFLRNATKEISFRTMVGLPELEPHKNKQPILSAGIYSKTRNPIYFAHWLLVFSAAAVSNFAANWILFALDCAVLPLLIRCEERELLTRYGPGYAAYLRRVPRFFPQLR